MMLYNWLNHHKKVLFSVRCLQD